MHGSFVYIYIHMCVFFLVSCRLFFVQLEATSNVDCDRLWSGFPETGSVLPKLTVLKMCSSQALAFSRSFHWLFLLPVHSFGLQEVDSKQYVKI